MLHAGSAIEIQVLFYLGFSLALRGLVDRKAYLLISVRHDFRHQRRVFGRDVLIIEMLKHAKTHNVSVEFNPAVHLSPAHVADHVIDIEKPGRATDEIVSGHSLKSRQESSVVRAALDKRMHGIAIELDR